MGTNPRWATSISPVVKTKAQLTGTAAEAAACAYLQNQGLRLLTRNYRGRRGEIDLIMQDRNQIVFIEVRYRRSTAFGDPSETISLTKQQRIIQTAWQYLLEKRHLQTAACRFDIVSLCDQQPIQWIKHAFEEN